MKQEFLFESMGTNLSVTIWDTISISKLTKLKNNVIKLANEFDQTYSRFIPNSFIRKIENKTGKIKVPTNFINMLFLYGKLFDYSNGLINPLIGHTISDLGYDESYSLVKKGTIRKTPHFSQTIKILDQTHILKNAYCLIDIGALGKGYFVDIISLFLFSRGISHFLVNGSGDIFYQGEKEISCGLEHPNDPKKVIGEIKITTGSLCASGINRRAWSEKNHIVNPKTHESVTDILAVWVLSSSAVIADALSTALFLTPPENFQEEFKFEYLILNREYKVKRSKGFNAKLY